MEILEKVYYKNNPGLSFIIAKNVTDLLDSEIIIISIYSIHLVPQDEFYSLLSLNKKIYIDGTYERFNQSVLKYLLEFRTLSNVYYFCMSSEFDYPPDLKESLRESGLNLIPSQYFIDYDHLFIPIFKNNYPNRKFLLYTGKPRSHRTLLVSLLSYYNLLDYGYVSFFGENYIVKGFHDETIDDVYSLNMSDELRNRIKIGLEKINLPLVLDTNIFGPEISHSKNFCADYYNSVDFVVVLETEVNNGIFFVTEKTTKCIILNKKFIVLSSTHFIKKLKDYYLTKFGQDISHLTDWCDTSYDNEVDFSIRIEKIIEVIKDNT